jgi:hypothetical protein
MIEYPKIDTLFDRDPDTFNVKYGVYRRAEFLYDLGWIVTEKIDGMNIRVGVLKGPSGIPGPYYSGRTDKSQLPKSVLDLLVNLFPLEKLMTILDPAKEPIDFVLFGEAYGPKIQNGGSYSLDVGFRLFDVAFLAEHKVWWQEWSDVEKYAKLLGVKTVPDLSYLGVDEAIDYVRSDLLMSRVALEEGAAQRKAEGIVVRSDPLLFNKKGDRAIWKLKAIDFKHGEKDA